MSAIQKQSALDLSPADWDDVHQQIQGALNRLVNDVRRSLPGIRTRAAMTRTSAFPLFSYLEFCWPDEPELEAVVVGVIFMGSTARDEFSVRGDVGGEETGCTYFSSPTLVVPASLESVRDAARIIAAQLSDKEDVVMRALQARQTPPSYRSGSSTS